MRTFRCVEYGCYEPAYYLIVYGCLDYHIRELLLCFRHGEEWAVHQQNTEISCAQCAQPVTDYEFTWVDKLDMQRVRI